MSLVNQVVGVQGQGEQRHGKDLKFGGRSFVKFSLCHLLSLYLTLTLNPCPEPFCFF